MNSEEEKQLFESYSWTYDFISRTWYSPDQSFGITTDMLVKYNESRQTEEQLKEFVRLHGKPSTT